MQQRQQQEATGTKKIIHYFFFSLSRYLFQGCMLSSKIFNQASRLPAEKELIHFPSSWFRPSVPAGKELSILFKIASYFMAFRDILLGLYCSIYLIVFTGFLPANYQGQLPKYFFSTVELKTISIYQNSCDMPDASSLQQYAKKCFS